MAASLFLNPAYWLSALLLACLAVVFTVVLVDANGFLRPVQFGIRVRYRLRNGGAEIDDDPKAWWWKPLWGCPACVSGQWGFWFFLFHWPPLRWYEAASAHWYGRIAFAIEHYSLFEHLGFAAITIILSFVVRKWIA